jgi:hypothetical protein
VSLTQHAKHNFQTTSKRKNHACGVIDTACKKIGNFTVEYLQEFIAEFKKAVVRESGIEIRLYRKGTYILADIHGMEHFCTKLAPPPYNKPRSCVSKIHTPMVMVWFGNV